MDEIVDSQKKAVCIKLKRTIMNERPLFMPQIQRKSDQEKEDFEGMEIKLTGSQINEFKKAMKAGVYRELYEKDLLTNSQLAHLLNHI